MTLPSGIDEGRISAYSDNGLLEINVEGGAVTESHRIRIGDKPA